MGSESASRLVGPAHARLRVTIETRDGQLERIRLLPAEGADAEEAGTGLAAAVGDRLVANPGGAGRGFPDWPLAPPRTPFQGRLRATLQALHPGQTVSYRDLATTLGSAPRAVAMAARANPFPLIVPCHRVVAVDGPGGYAGASEGPLAAFKAWLLEREAARGVD
ncbi:MAG: methylated-DNA--[protein]-cysteine S-methyltransferase [Pseudomonadota bacterium]